MSYPGLQKDGEGRWLATAKDIVFAALSSLTFDEIVYTGEGEEPFLVRLGKDLRLPKCGSTDSPSWESRC